ncbi:GntR family transcriptional regulator [Streptomyces sp. NBC_01622]|uniref:GntR family transcriptional regulator n=1 Tax=Streptomyces sp. NBC_01622 TaxID=2975903 RepID=UPI00386BC506|nr:GntR family transcriptional regulator [Streptomyces sp. NBC_01622]
MVTVGPAGTEKPLALFRQVAADPGREIGEGRYGSGGRPPAEGELAERYGVSRGTGTVRQPMALLRTEGLIASRRGTRRVVIGTPRPQSFGELLSFPRWGRSTGEEPGGRIVAAETRPADATERERLRLPAGAEIHAVRRLRTLSGRPVTSTPRR